MLKVDLEIENKKIESVKRCKSYDDKMKINVEKFKMTKLNKMLRQRVVNKVYLIKNKKNLKSKMKNLRIVIKYNIQKLLIKIWIDNQHKNENDNN